MTPSPVPTLLTRYRQAAGLSMNALARAARVDPSMVCKLEHGQRIPHREVVAALSRALALAPVDADRLMIAAGYAPEWMVTLAGVARIAPRAVTA